MSGDSCHLPPPARGVLRCLPHCPCRCHDSLVTSLIPRWLAFYIGQVYISKRLLTPAFSPWSRCNVQTCRGDLQRAITIRWILPPGLLSGCLQSSKTQPIHIFIGAPRIIPFDSLIFEAIRSRNIRSVRELFATGQASIWDHDFDGAPIFMVSLCWAWFRTIH